MARGSGLAATSGPEPGVTGRQEVETVAVRARRGAEAAHHPGETDELASACRRSPAHAVSRRPRSCPGVRSTRPADHRAVAGSAPLSPRRHAGHARRAPRRLVRLVVPSRLHVDPDLPPGATPRIHRALRVDAQPNVSRACGFALQPRPPFRKRMDAAFRACLCRVDGSSRHRARGALSRRALRCPLPRVHALRPALALTLRTTP